MGPRAEARGIHYILVPFVPDPLSFNGAARRGARNPDGGGARRGKVTLASMAPRAEARGILADEKCPPPVVLQWGRAPRRAES